MALESHEAYRFIKYSRPMDVFYLLDGEAKLIGFNGKVEVRPDYVVKLRAFWSHSLSFLASLADHYTNRYLCKQSRSDEMADIMNHLTRIYTVCHSVLDFWLTSLHVFTKMDVTKANDGRINFRNLGWKVMRTLDQQYSIAPVNVIIGDNLTLVMLNKLRCHTHF